MSRIVYRDSYGNRYLSNMGGCYKEEEFTWSEKREAAKRNAVTDPCFICPVCKETFPVKQGRYVQPGNKLTCLKCAPPEKEKP